MRAINANSPDFIALLAYCARFSTTSSRPSTFAYWQKSEARTTCNHHQCALSFCRHLEQIIASLLYYLYMACIWKAVSCERLLFILLPALQPTDTYMESSQHEHTYIENGA